MLAVFAVAPAFADYEAGHAPYTESCTVNVFGGDLTTPATAPTKRGHTFTGWTFNTGN